MVNKRKGALTYKVRRFKSLAIALKELEPFIRNGQYLQSGRPFKQLNGMLPREAVANWLMCAALDFEFGSGRMSFSSDPTGGDGVLHDSNNHRTWRTEHVMVRRPLTIEEAVNAKTVETQILQAVRKKQAKGIQYASGKLLIVFLDAGSGAWFPNKAARLLPRALLFSEVWIVGLHGVLMRGCGFVYAVTQLNLTSGDAPTWLVRIEEDFLSWTVSRLQ